MTEDEFDEVYDQRMDAISARVEAAFPDSVVEFSAFTEDDDGLPVDNLDEIAIRGRARFIQKHDSFWGEGEDYTSDVVENPTWFDLLRIADEMIRTTGDEHHRFLEAFELQHTDADVDVYELWMGS